MAKIKKENGKSSVHDYNYIDKSSAVRNSKVVSKCWKCERLGSPTYNCVDCGVSNCCRHMNWAQFGDKKFRCDECFTVYKKA